MLKEKKKFFILFTFIFLLFFLLSTTTYAETPNYIYVAQKTFLIDISNELEQYGEVEFFDSQNNQITDFQTLAKTGIKIVCYLYDTNITTTYQLVVKGDVNGDGEVNEEDIYQIKSDLVGLTTLENEFAKACDKNEDDTISLSDLLSNKQYLKNESSQPEIEEKKEIEVSKITLNSNSLDLEVGGYFILEASISPENATYPEITFFSNDSNIASVDQNGKVTAIKNGSTQIIATSSNGLNASCKVTVYTTPTSLELNKKEVTLFINGTSSYTLIPSFTPSTADRKTAITWSSSDSNIVSVDENGKITAVGNGTAKITAITEDNLESNCNVTVHTLPISLDMPEKLSIEKGASSKIEVSIYPETADYGTDITFYNDSKDIVSVSNDGTIEAKHPGEAIITVKTTNGISKTCYVTVYTEIKDIVFDRYSATLDLSTNASYQIIANSDSGENITNTLTWSSSNEEVATITSSGKIQGHSNGKATITGSINNIEKTFDLEVHTSPKSLTLEKSSISFNVDEEKTLTYTMSPDNVDIYNTINWSSTNDNIVTVDSNGKIKAISTGRAVIKAECGINNSIFAVCPVLVTTTPSEILFDQSQMLLKQSETKKLLLNFNEPIENFNLDNLSIVSNLEGILSYKYDATPNNSNQIELSITGLEEGQSTITASIDNLSTSCDIIVYSNLSSIDLYIKDVLLNDTTQSLALTSDTSIFNVSAKLNNTYDISNLVTWESSDTTKATINSFGGIYAFGVGSTVISAKLENLNTSFTLEIKKLPQSINMTNSIQLYINGTTTAKLQPSISPSDCSNTSIKYSSSNEEIVTVNSDGTIEAKKAGTAVITATTVNNISATCTVTVKTAPNGISFSTESMYLKKTGKATLKPTISPIGSDAYNNLTWTSDNSNIVSVDSYGNVEAKSPGTANITVKTGNEKTDSIQVIVPNLSVKATTNSLDLTTNASTTIVNNGSTNIGTLSYSSVNSNIATVNSSGVITAKSNGSTSITVTESNAGTSVSIPISVTTSTSSVSLNSQNVKLDITSKTYQLTATQNPSTVSNKGIIWTSSDTNVATVNGGKITRVAPGTATITATANDGSNKSATCTVVVKKEKLIICGPSTVCRLAGTHKTSSTNGDVWGIDYKKEFGYTVKATLSQSSGVYKNITHSTDDATADLFFICQSGRGLRYFAGTSFNGKSVSMKNTENVECFDNSSSNGVGGTSLENLLKAGNTHDWHFSVAFVCSGNDLTVGNMSASIVENIAILNADYCSYLASTYPNHDFYVFPITPVDESNVGENSPLLTQSFSKENSNNAKRYRFACKLNSTVKGKKQSNLHDASGFFLYLFENSLFKGTRYGHTFTGNKNFTKLNGKHSTTAAYRAYDGKHYTKWGCRIVMEKILTTCGVVDSKGMKLK